MGYLKIHNLYKEKEILLFKDCYALEKIHGTSSHLYWKDEKLSFFSGGENHKNFVSLFNQEKLIQIFNEFYPIDHIVIYGEAYGGKQQGMKATYGDKLKFIAFDVRFNEHWQCVPSAERIVANLELEFVDYAKIPSTIEAIDLERDKDSTQAIRNGMGTGHKREGVVLRSIIELIKNNGERVISKHKRDDFSEVKTPRKVNDEELKILEEAEAISEEWCTSMRLNHVLDKFTKDVTTEDTGEVIVAMIEDIYIEAKGEIVESKDVRKAIGRKTRKLLDRFLVDKLKRDDIVSVDTNQEIPDTEK